METTDESILAGLKREKDEEVGEKFKVKIFPTMSYNSFFRKKDGNAMILPHYLAVYIEGEIILSDEYSEYRWVSLEEITSCTPLIPNIPEVIKILTQLPIDQTKSVII